MPSLILKDHFSKGIKRKKEGLTGSMYLEKCIDLKPDVDCGVKYETYTDPTGALSGERTFPFPQIFRSDGLDYVFGKDKIYFLDSSNAPQAITVYKTTLSATENLTDTGFSSGALWDFTAVDWSYDGTNDYAVKAAGSGGDMDLVQVAGNLNSAFVNGKLYRIILNVVDVTVAGNISVLIGSDQSSSRVVELGTMEFEVLCTGAGDFTLRADEDSAFSITSINIKEVETYGNFGLGASSKPWHFVSFKDVWFATNGSIFLCHVPSNGTVGATTVAGDGPMWRVIGIPAATMKLGCLAKLGNTLYMSGFNGALSHFASAAFQNIWSHWINHRKGEVTYEGYEINEKTCFYSKANGGDYFWPWAIELALFGIPDSDILSDSSQFLIDAFKKNEVGFFQWPFKGECLRIERVGNSIIGFGADGVARATPRDIGGILVHDVEILSRVGIADKGATAGDDGAQAYIDKQYHLRLITTEGINDLLYQDEFESFVTGVSSRPIVATYDPELRDFYFSTNQYSRCLTQTGLGQPVRCYTSIIHDELTALGVHYPSLITDGKVRILTEPFDFQERMLKQIHDVEIGVFDATSIRIRIWYKDDNSSTFRSTEWISVFSGGFASPIVSGFDFKLEVELSAGTDFRFEYARLVYDIRDERNVRRHHRRRG